MTDTIDQLARKIAVGIAPGTIKRAHIAAKLGLQKGIQLERDRCAAIAPEKLEYRFRWEYAKGSDVAEMRTNISANLYEAGDCKLIWANEGDLYLLPFCDLSTAIRSKGE